jgi:hypothetical protein
MVLLWFGLGPLGFFGFLWFSRRFGYASSSGPRSPSEPDVYQILSSFGFLWFVLWYSTCIFEAMDIAMRGHNALIDQYCQKMLENL